MKTAFLVLSFLILIAVNASMACSVSVDNTAQKNLLAAHGASYLDVDLTSVSSTSITGYHKMFAEEDPSSHCPTVLETEATVKFAYSPAAKEECEAQVKVSRRIYIGENPAASFESIEYDDLEAICATSSAGRISVRPVRPVRDIPTVRPVRPIRP